MAYITTTQLSARLGSTLYARLTDRVNGTSADAAVAQQIVDEAEAVADSHLSVRYATPVDLSAQPELANVLEARVLDLAEHAAWRSSPFVNNIPARIAALHEAALEWLEAVAEGKIHLPAAAPPASGTAADDSPRYSSSERKFSADELDGL
jgi:phage gp36-like protein